MEIRRPLHSEMEELVVAKDDSIGFHAVIAVHSTLLGPAICGMRFRDYLSEDEALEDASKTASQGTSRAVLANVPLGGASAAIFNTTRSGGNREEIFRAFGRLVEEFDGRLIATEDLGCRSSDIDAVKECTPLACGGSSGKPGDPTYFTALGVLRSIEACVHHVWKSDGLKGLHVSVLGVGRVGFQLCEMLHLAGAKLSVSDIIPGNVDRAVKELNAIAIRPRDMLDQKCDLLAPCAIGSLLDSNTIKRLKCKIIAGSSNNQLVNPNRHGRMLHQREIVYAPGFVVNAGALYTNACEIDNHGLSHATILVNGIYDTIYRILDQSKTEDVPTSEIARRISEEKLRKVRQQQISQYL